MNVKKSSRHLSGECILSAFGKGKTLVEGSHKPAKGESWKARKNGDLKHVTNPGRPTKKVLVDNSKRGQQRWCAESKKSIKPSTTQMEKGTSMHGKGGSRGKASPKGGGSCS